MRILIWLSLILVILNGCQEKSTPRTLYFSAFTYRYNDLNDSIDTIPKFYHAYYIEVADTGTAKLMKRERFNAPMCYYNIHLRDTVKSEILNLAFNDSTYIKKQLRDDHNLLYCGFSFSLQALKDTIHQRSLFIPYYLQGSGKRLYQMLDNIYEHPQITDTIKFNLQSYEEELDNYIRNRHPFNSPPQVKEFNKV